MLSVIVIGGVTKSVTYKKNTGAIAIILKLLQKIARITIPDKVGGTFSAFTEAGRSLRFRGLAHRRGLEGCRSSF